MRDQNQIAKGQHASMLIDGLKDVFARLQMEYVAETAIAAKRGENTQTPAMKLAVLDDIVESLMQEVVSGRKAQAKVDKRVRNTQEIRDG